MTISVLIVDDDELMRTGLRGILATDPDIEVVGEASDGERARLRARDLSPDVVLMDVRMPGEDGITATREICADAEGPRVVILTTFAHDNYVVGALRAGASGFLLKRASPEELIRGVKDAADGELTIAREVMALVVAEATRATPRRAVPDEISSLTPKEREVLGHLARGHSNAEIAAQLVVETSTIKTHVKALLAKLGLRDRVQAVIWAYENGVITPGDDDS